MAPKSPFPAQVEDVKCAVRFLRAHAAKLRIDPNRIAAMGFSAGGHLAMMLGVTDPGAGLEGTGGWADQSSRVQAVVSFFGPTQLDARNLPDASRKVVHGFLNGTPAEKPDVYRRASPLTHVSKDDAPMLLFQGTRDPLVPYTQVYPMAEAMTRMGVPGRVELLIGAGHGWGGADLKQSSHALLEFLGRYLREAAPTHR